MNRTELISTLVSVLVQCLIAEREAILNHLERKKWQWDAELSGNLEQIDYALADLGYFNFLDVRPRKINPLDVHFTP